MHNLLSFRSADSKGESVPIFTKAHVKLIRERIKNVFALNYSYTEMIGSFLKQIRLRLCKVPNRKVMDYFYERGLIKLQSEFDIVHILRKIMVAHSMSQLKSSKQLIDLVPFFNMNIL